MTGIRDLISARAAAAGCLALLLGSVPASSQDAPSVTLEAPDGSYAVTGQLLSYESEVYILDVPGSGIVKIEGILVECVAGACPPGAPTRKRTAAAPAVDDTSRRFGIYGADTIGSVLMPNLWRGYAESVGAEFEIEITADASERIIRLTNRDGSPRAEILLQTKGSASAVPAVVDGNAAIAMTDRRLTAEDVTRLRAGGLPDLRGSANEIVVGIDGVVLITHPDNPVRDLSAEDISRIFSGEVTNWRELGGGNFPIVVNSFDADTDGREMLLDTLVRPQGRQEKRDVVRHATPEEMVAAVGADRGAIGYAGRWLARTANVNQITIRQTCGLLSPPTDFQMKIEGYALSRRVYLYSSPDTLPAEAAEFLGWVRSADAQRWIRESNFADNGIARMQLADMGMMLIHTAVVEPDFSPRQYIEMMTELRTADRMSVSLRFRSGSSFLDQDSTDNLERLAALAEQGEFDGMELLVVGFADSIGDQVRNTQLAASRAESVRQLLAGRLSNDARRRVRLTTLSYGELLPLSCNDDDAGRARNRRVEVWLRNPNKVVVGR